MTPPETCGVRPLVLISGLPVGGAERVTTLFLRHLASTGRSIPVCTLTDRHDGPPAEEVSRAGIRRFDLGARRLVDPAAVVRLLRILRREGTRLIHAHGQDASIVAAAVCAVHPTALVVTRHVLDEPANTVRQRLRAALALASLRRADGVVAVSRAVASRLLASGRVPHHRIHVIYNGIDHRAFTQERMAAARVRVRSSLGVGERARVILVPAVLREGKGHDVLLSALPVLRRRIPDVRVLVAGDGEMAESLRRRAEAEAVEDVVDFLGFRRDVPDLMAAADVVALPSFAEALPTALLEAAAAGRPVVATRVGGTPEVVAHGRTGLLVPPNDAPALRRALLTLLTDGERVCEMGRRARLRAEARFGIARQVDRTLRLWRTLAAGRSSGLP